MKKRVLLFALALLLTFSLFPSISYADVTTDLDYACRIAATQTWYWPFSTANITDAYGKITSSYGYRKDEAQGLDSVHYGLDIGMQKNTPVYPIQSGFVTYIKNSNSGSRGRYLIIKHDNGFCSMYLHLQEIKVNNGDRVYPSTEIALSGGSGKGSDNGYANHLHFQILYGNPNSSGIIENNLSINPCPAGYTRKGSSFVKGYPMENASDNGGKKFSDNNPRVSYIAMDRSMPTCTHTQGYETVNEGGRYFARCKECHEEYNPEFISDSAGTYRITSNIKLNSAPYQEAQTSVSCKIGQQVTIRGHVINAYNNKWYQTSDGYYIYHEYAELVQQTSTLSVSGHTGNPGTPTGTLTRGSNFGLRGIITSNYTITNVEAHIYDSNGKDAKGTTEYKTNWNSKSYNIQTNGINNHFSFSALTNGTYRYVVKASDSATNEMKTLIESWFNVGTSTTPVQQYLDQCKSEPCDVTLTVTEPGHMNIMPCSTQTNPQAATVSDDDKNLVVGNTYHSTVQWTNTVGHIWYETTSKTGQRGFVYSGDVSVMMVYTIKEYYDPNISSTLSISGYEGGIPAGNLVQGSNFGLRGVISSNYTITHIEAHIYKSDGTDALPSYSTDWNSTNYDIRTDGINNHFHFRDLPTGTNYNYSVRASDSSGTSLPLIDSYFNIGTSSTSTLTYLNLDGFLDGAPNDGLAQYGTADVYINGQLVANACNDYWEAWTPGTTYEIKNVRANDGYRFNGVYSGSLSGTIGTERINVVLSFSKTAILDLNGCLDGNPYYGNIEGYGTADIYINGKLAAEGVSDYCTDFLVGTTYEIKNIRANDGYRFNGVYSGSLSGTIGTERVNVVLSFSKMAILDLNGWLDNNLSWGNIDGYGVVDIYINDELVADSVSDYCSDLPIGTKYEIKNIRALDGHHYDGVHSGALSGVIDSDKVEVFLSFSKITENIIINEDNFPDDVFRAWISNNCDTDGNGILQEAEINAVTTIDVSGTWDNPGMISTIDGIEFFNTLLYLDCSHNQLTNIDVSQNTKLKCLYCFSNDLTSLDVSRNTDLEILECGYNPICNLDTSRNTGLTHLYCYDNQLTSLDVSQNTSLVFLECSSNQLGALNVSNNTSLVSLAIGYNQLQYIDISHNTELKSLTCWSNQLSMLDIGSNPYLQSCVSDGLFTVENGVYYYSLSEEEKLALDSGVNLIVSSPEPDFILPASLTIIGAEAFLGDAFTVVKLSDKTVAISTRAFANCQNLEYIYIPASTTKIAPDVFLGTNDLTILGASGSYAETYAMTFGFTFIAIS